MPTEGQAAALLELLDTHVPIAVLQTHDEKRVLALAEAVARRTQRALWAWSASNGLRALHGLKLRLVEQGTDGHPGAADTHELPAALKAMAKVEGPALVLLLDIHPYLNHPVTVRALKDLALASERTGVQLAFVAHALTVPDELQPWAAAFEIEPMTPERVRTVLREEITRQRSRSGRDVAGCQRTLESLQRHLVGLPEASVRHLARLALGDGQITTADLTRVLAAKQAQLGAAELLVFEPDLPAMDQVAGMTALKRWLLLRRAPFLDPAAAEGLPPPKGVLLLGVQGGGKSLAAKAVAASWQLPLFRMDFGALYDKWQGESERKLREALRVAESMQPCVVWMDEVEKGLAGGSAGSDDGTGATRRMLGTLLTWMAERRSRVFLVATANDIQALPPELVRKGRFDEIFFVDLPDEGARAELMRIHLGRLKVAFDEAQLATLVVASTGFSGAEIEAAAVAARYEALALGREANAAAVLAELARTKPLSVTRAEAIAALRAWAAERAVPAG
ncbi:MAG: AAA family ATPase [Burkholderiaceae bacterium]|nr:AAA family ATPase [Burkholderiaceae bacterium]